MRRLTAIVAALMLVLFGCAGQQALLESPGGADVLTASTILADIARNIAGDRLVVESFLPVGADPHSYQPTPQDTAKLSQTRLLIVNGAGYEHFLQALLENADGEGTLVEASTGLSLRTDPEHGVDPHLWLDPNNVIAYVENIREALTHLDPQGSKIYQSNAESYVEQLQELDAWIENQVEQIPPERRVLVTNHEAFGYFAERYGFTIVGTIIESFSSDASPSAQQMAELIDQIRQSQAHAIFLDASDNPALARQVAAETGVQVVTDLYVESLTDGVPAGSYIDLMKYNATKIVEALK